MWQSRGGVSTTVNAALLYLKYDAYSCQVNFIFIVTGSNLN